MPQTIRDVVVRIALEQVETELKAPNTAAAKASFEDLSDANRKFHEAAVDAAQDYERVAVNAFDGISDELEEVNRLWKEAVTNQDEAAQAVEYAGQQIAEMHDLQIRAAEGFRTMGEGAFTAARGVAFLVASNDDDFQKMLRTIAQFQGAFDVFKGGLDVIKGLNEGLRAWRATTAAAVTANAALSASQAAVGATATTAAGGVVALKSAINPLLGVLAVAAVAVGGLGFALARSRTKETAEEVDELTRSYDELEFKIRTTSVAVTEATAEYLSFGENIIRARNELQQLGQLASDFQLEILTTTDEEERLAAAQNLQRVLERQLIVEQRLGRLRSQQADDIRRGLEERQRELETQRKQLEIERQRQQTQEAQIGRLTGAERLTLQRLGETSRQRRLSRGELETVSRLGGSAVSGFVEAGFARFGREAGAESILDPFQIAARPARQSRESQQLAKSFEEFNENDRAAKEQTVNALRQLAARSARIAEQIQEIQDRVHPTNVRE